MHSDQNLNEANNLAQQEYWDNAYANHNFSIADKDHVVRKWIEQYVPASNGSCIEIGSFPGSYLAVFGELGYELSGIDLTPRVVDDLPKWMKECKYKIGLFEKADIFKFNTLQRFDVVCSFGFIEHFKNWKEVINIHADLVAEKGYVVIVTPNFRGIIQRIIHWLLDYENYKRHYIPAMHPGKWKTILKQLGFEIKYCGYIGKFDFWVDVPPEKPFQKFLFKNLLRSRSSLSSLLGINGFTSPYIGIVAKKK